ncbi:MAG: hypothetical protein CML45_05645 [Rhodobacteraceae bacterium]|nr:hypothetical protein [Paracoccaceae bacterium]
MSFDSKAQHEFFDAYLQNYEFGIFTGDVTIPLRELYYEGETYSVALPAKYAQLDLPGDDGSGIGYPTQNYLYTQINQYPYLLRDSYTTSGDAYQGGPGFTYSLQQTAGGWFGEGAYIDVAARAAETEGAVGGTRALGYRFIIRALDAGAYPTIVGPELRLSYNYKILKGSAAESLGYSVTDEMTKIQAFYLNCKPLMTQVLADCVYPEQYNDSRGTSDIGKFTETYKLRALNFFAQTGERAVGTGYAPFTDIVKSSTFVATGLPFFDDYGFMNIKDGDFTHLQSNRAAGAKPNSYAMPGYQTIDREQVSTIKLMDLLGPVADEKKLLPNYFWKSDFPSARTADDFALYFRGNGNRFAYGAYGDPTLVDEEGSASGPMRLLDKSLHYRFDPSCIPYTSFRMHYDLKNANMSINAIDFFEVYHPAIELSMPDFWAGDGPAQDYILSYGTTSGASYAFKYNLESAICGRVPPIFTLEAKLNSEDVIEKTSKNNDRIQMFAVSYDNSSESIAVDGDAGQGSYTTFEKQLLLGNLYLKSRFPFPWDGGSRISNFDTRGSSFGNIGYASANNIMDPMVDDGTMLDGLREYYADQKDLGIDYMAWSYDPGGPRQGSTGIGMAYNRYKTSLRAFFGTKEMNTINCFHSLKKHVDKLAGAWTYDADPKESRIRMQKRLPFKKSDFTSLSEGYSDSEIQGTAVTLDDEPATTSDTAVLPDDMGGTGGAY